MKLYLSSHAAVTAFPALAASSARRRTLNVRRLLSGWLVLALAALGLGATSVSAKEKKDLDIALVAKQVVVDAAGRESLITDLGIEPGGVLQYTATYRNTSAAPLRKLAPTVPIPAGMEFIPGSASPAPALASLDGKVFEAFPIRRLHKFADGREILTEVPASAYRAFRWATGDLSPASEVTIGVRARVTINTVAMR